MKLIQFMKNLRAYLWIRWFFFKNRMIRKLAGIPEREPDRDYSLDYAPYTIGSTNLTHEEYLMGGLLLLQELARTGYFAKSKFNDAKDWDLNEVTRAFKITGINGYREAETINATSNEGYCYFNYMPTMISPNMHPKDQLDHGRIFLTQKGLEYLENTVPGAKILNLKPKNL